MLNGTLCATERALCCLVENYQTSEVCFPAFLPAFSVPFLPAFVRSSLSAPFPTSLSPPLPTSVLIDPTPLAGLDDPGGVAAIHAGARVPAVGEGAAQGFRAEESVSGGRPGCPCVRVMYVIRYLCFLYMGWGEEEMYVIDVLLCSGFG